MLFIKPSIVSKLDFPISHPHINSINELTYYNIYHYRYIPHCKPITYLFEKEKEFNEMSRLLVIEKILKTVYYLHSNDLVHRDIKAENVVYSQAKYIKELNESMNSIDSNYNSVTSNYSSSNCQYSSY